MKRVEFNKTSVSSSKIAAILNRSKYRDVIAQYKLDTKQEKQTYSEVGRQKAAMGTKMEDLIHELAVENLCPNLVVDKTRYHHDDHEFFRVEFDALDYENQVVYEYKNTEMDEAALLEAYYPQVQFAMYIIGWEKARIVYLHNGWNLGYIEVDRDENFLKHMETVCTYYWNCLLTYTEPDPLYINDIVDNIDFYTKIDERKGVDIEAELTPKEVEKLYEWGRLKKEMKLLEIEEARIKGYFADKYGKFRDEQVTFSNIEYTRKGNIDTNKLAMDHPEIDLDQYRKPDTTYQRVMLKYRTPAEEEDITINREKDIV